MNDHAALCDFFRVHPDMNLLSSLTDMATQGMLRPRDPEGSESSGNAISSVQSER